MLEEQMNASDVNSASTSDVEVQHQPTDPANDTQVQVSNQSESDSTESRFKQLAKQAVSQTFSDSEDLDETSDVEDDTDDIPAETETEEVDENATEEDTQEPVRETRASKFKTVVAENEQLNTRIAEVDAKLERFGGIEGFEVLGNVLDAFMNLNGKFEIPGENGEMTEVTGKDLVYDFVNELPERDSVYSEFFLKGLENQQNRVFAINDVLKQEYGLKADANVSQDQINTIFDNITAKINLAKDASEVEKIFKDLAFDTEQLGYNGEEFAYKTENEKLKAELEALKNPAKQTQPQETDPQDSFIKEYETALAEEQKNYQAQDTLIVNLFDTVAVDLLTQAGWASADGDSDTAKAAKQKFSDIVLGKDNIAQRIRSTEAFKKVAGYIKNGNLENSRTGQIALNNLKIAMKSQVTSLLKDLSLLAEETKTTTNTTKTGNTSRASITSNKNPEEKMNFRQRANEALGR